MATSPAEALESFFAAFNRGDLVAAMALYEKGATFVAGPGQFAEGETALRQVLSGFLAMKPTLNLEKYSIVPADDIALSLAKWSLVGTDADGRSVQMSGTTTDVLRRQIDGRWLFIIDNPWGANLLE